MALSSASTRADALAQVRDNLSYRTDPTGAAARALEEAINFLIFYPEEVQSSTNSRERYNLHELRQLRSEAQAFLATCSTSNGGVSGTQQPRQISFERFR